MLNLTILIASSMMISGGLVGALVSHGHIKSLIEIGGHLKAAHARETALYHYILRRKHAYGCTSGSNTYPRCDCGYEDMCRLYEDGTL